MMEAADEAVEQMYSWIEKRELGAMELQKLAKELEGVRDACNAFEVVGSTVATVGYATIVAAGIATFLTGGVAAPALAIAAGIGGTAVSVGAKVLEHFSSSSTLKKAEEIADDCNDKAERLQQLFKELKAQSPDPDQEDQYILNTVMVAMSRRSGLLDFDPSFLFEDRHRFNFGGLGEEIFMRDSLLLEKSTIAGFICVLNFFYYAPSGKKLDLLLTKGSQKLIQRLSTGLKTAVKGGSQIVGGAVGLMFSFPEAVESWEELIKGNHVTEASQSLKETAKSLLRETRTLKQKLNKLKTTFDRLKKVQLCIQNPQRTQPDKMMLIQFAIELCHDEEVKQWLRENAESMAFFMLVDIFYMVGEEMMKKYSNEENEIDIVFVAHGSITEALIPSSCLLPSPRIEDVLLYSPWNCAIDSRAAYGIASGRILPQHREFSCGGKCPIPSSSHQPTTLPNNWNSMKNARGGVIPNIMVSPVGMPGDNAWKSFMDLSDTFRYPYKARVVIPFILPGNVKVSVPFFVVTLALSLVLFFTKQKATIHLSACLSKISKDTEIDVYCLINQYSYTIDKTLMSCSWDMFPIKDQILYRLLRVVFDQTRGHNEEVCSIN